MWSFFIVFVSPYFDLFLSISDGKKPVLICIGVAPPRSVMRFVDLVKIIQFSFSAINTMSGGGFLSALMLNNCLLVVGVLIW